MTQLHPKDLAPFPVAFHPAQTARPALTDQVFGTVFFEVIGQGLPGCTTPSLPGWTVRVWPQARLGDATLEARPDGEQTLDGLLLGLRAQGITALGPVRRRR